MKLTRLMKFYLRGYLEIRPVSPVRAPGLQNDQPRAVSCRPRALTRRLTPLSKCIPTFLFLSLAILDSLAQSWQPTSAPTNFWNCVASSADGSKLVASDGFDLYTSTNSGTDWFPAPVSKQAWVYVASSADGSKLAAVA